MPHKEIALNIEYFYNDEDLEFHISSKREMLSILQNLADMGTRVALYYGRGHNFVLTTLLGANEHGMWLDVGPFPPENKQLLLSDKITFVSSHQHVKIQFEALDIQNDLFENNEAFYLELPEFLLRLQRREFFRTSIPSSTPLKCLFPLQPANPDEPAIMKEMPIVDISGGGIGLLCEELESVFQPEKTFPGCQISIPDVGILKITIEVRNCINLDTRGKAVRQRIGCRFIGLDRQMDILLQRYIARLQSEQLARL